jgi:site-specific recombinase XerD
LDNEQIDYLQVSYTDLLAYIEYHKARGNAKNTINGKLQGIKHFYNYLQQAEKVAYNPAEELRIKGTITRQPHDLLEWEDLEQLYKKLPSKQHHR